MRISLHQMTTTLDVESNTAIVVAEIERAAAAEAELACFPEAVNVLCGDQQALRAAIPREHDCLVLAQARIAARRFGVSVNLGSVLLRLDDGVLVNRSCLIGARGEVLATYDKVHLFDAQLDDDSELESALYRPGDAAVLVRTPSANLGLTIFCGWPPHCKR
ncbi:Carbon-nitrogen hydrolase [Devosia sp. LC5]|uniref:nitrilase-related carbon-nitrogen hydrolase n=1 Tax=Devosia sp. LC5 TaxID=1502724 RepID=UPI0004E3FB3A|nr:nitrilase-related carbon-nitrogen hydrolase [Devosia sp. LC5]KFC67200.1 Carbon-nitrogen hydrolase [Devosia sp. LC5]